MSGIQFGRRTESYDQVTLRNEQTLIQRSAGIYPATAPFSTKELQFWQGGDRLGEDLGKLLVGGFWRGFDCYTLNPRMLLQSSASSHCSVPADSVLGLSVRLKAELKALLCVPSQLLTPRRSRARLNGFFCCSVSVLCSTRPHFNPCLCVVRYRVHTSIFLRSLCIYLGKPICIHVLHNAETRLCHLEKM